MNMERRAKYSGQGKNVLKNETIKVDINFDLNALNLMCAYVISENRNIRNSHLINMRNLFEMIDTGLYINDVEKMKRLDFIKKGLEGRLVQNLRNSVLVIKYINGGLMEDDVIDINNFSTLSSKELEWIDETVSESLKYSYIYNDIDQMIDICTRFKAADYRSRSSIVQEFESHVTKMQTKFRKARAESMSEIPFTLREDAFEEVMKDIHERITNPSNLLATGMQGINQLTGGGFYSGKVYMLLGLTGVGKSLTLLNLAIQMKKYNKNYKAKDPTKKPVILYMTMENTVSESVERLFTISTGLDLRDCDVDDAIKMLREDGELYLTDESPIDIIIKFVPDRSVDTGYLYTMVEDLEDEGYEVICLIQDHIKRIRSCYKQPDIRAELGAVVNEFKVFSAVKDIPVITNSHLNRDGAKTVDEGAKANSADLTRMLGRANIGESMLMLDNLDLGCIINVEYDVNGNKYMVFKRVKVRYKAGIRDYICQPFDPKIPIKLLEDVNEQVPLFKETLRPTPDQVELYSGGASNKYQNASVKDLDSNLAKRELTDENIFSGSRYSLSSKKSDTIYLDDDGLEITDQIKHIENKDQIPMTCGKRFESQPHLRDVITRVNKTMSM